MIWATMLKKLKYIIKNEDVNLVDKNESDK